MSNTFRPKQLSQNMGYTNTEKKAILKLLSDMMIIDGNINQNEKQYLDHVKNTFRLSDESLKPIMDRDRAISVISNLNDDQKMEVASMLQQMMKADGILDEQEMYFWGEILTRTGIHKVIESKTAFMNIQHDDSLIYLNASKISLSRRTPEYLNSINKQAKIFKDMFSNSHLTINDKCNLILEYTRQCVKDSGWDLNDVDGVTWFIGNFTDAMVKSGIIDNYEDMFVLCFKKYFNL